MSLGCSQPLLCSSLLILYTSLNVFPVISSRTNMCYEQACGKAIAKASEYKSSTFFFFLNTINLISCLVAHLSETPPHISNIPPFCPVCFPSFLAASLPAALSSPPPLPPLCASLLPSLLFSPPACLPSSFHLSSLKLTVPKGRGHLRTKWGISRQLCAHSLRWPSIIHSLLTPPFPSLHLHSALFIAPCRLRLYFSAPFFFLKYRDCMSASCTIHSCHFLA